MTACTAFILEDSPIQARIIARMIEAQGWSTIHSASLLEATEKLKHASVQALFLDVYVGIFNTITNIDQFRALAPATPIVIMTAGSGREAIEDTLKRARQANADHVLRKPFTDAQLKHVLEFAIRDLQSGERRKHALVIDDSKTIRSVACRMFESANFRVSQACTMEDAFDNVDIARVDLILCDIFMPGMAGFKGMRMIKRSGPRSRSLRCRLGLKTRLVAMTC